jgi:GTP diphosphokinase / guanosine-3',5'-bis(diphosphate) 3'-diphosphatase
MDMQIEEKDFEQFLQALRFAAQKHRDQRRKDSAHSPYINHPIAVAEILWRIGGVRDTTTLVAALLHDTVEDTGTSPDEISTRFGEVVRDLVMEVTDDKSLPKARRKELQVEHAPHKSPQAKQIKLADKINNVVDITYTPPSDWSKERLIEYLDWTQRVVNGLRGQNSALEAEYDRVLAEGKAALEKL